MLIRKNKGAQPLAGNPGFSLRLGVAVPLHNPDANGLPQAEESNALSRIEDALVAQLQEERKAIAVLTITTNGMREFVFYTGDAAWASSTVETVRLQTPSHQLQSYVEPDTQWSVYKAFKL